MNKGNKALSRDGLPIDAKAWTREDWQDLHEAIEKVKRNVRERHARTSDNGIGIDSEADGTISDSELRG